jgi:hypothetical protein
VKSQPICLRVWLATIGCLGLGVLIASLVPPPEGISSHYRMLQVMVGAGVFATTLWIAIKIVIHLSQPPVARFIKSVAAFIMSMTLALGGGSWLAIPVFRVPAIQDVVQIEVTTSDAMPLSITAVSIGFLSLVALVAMFPRHKES